MASPSQSKVWFFTDVVKLTLANRQVFKRFIETLFKREGKKLNSLNYIFCSDKRIIQINREYLKHDYYTDIISFDLSDKPSGVVGEIYISLDRVRENANRLGIPFKTEIHRVILHGALHLCGYKDKKTSEIQTMREKEDYYLSLYRQMCST